MRKKLPAILSAALLAALILLTACSGGKPALPAWLDENEICAETYKALTEAMPKAVEPTDEEESSGEDASSAVFFGYDEELKLPYFDFTAVTKEEAEKAAEALKIVWNGKDIPLIDARANTSDQIYAMLEFFSSFDCSNMQLRLPVLYTLIGAAPGINDTLSAGDIKELTTLIISSNAVVIPPDAGYLPCSKVKELTIPGNESLTDIDRYFPNAEKLSLTYSDEIPPNEAFDESLKKSSVKELNYTMRDGSGITPTIKTVEFFERMKAVESLETINGSPREEFEIPMTEEIRKELEEKKAEEELNAVLEDVRTKCKNYDYDTKDESGTIKLRKKLIVICDTEYSIKSAIRGEPFEGIPAKRLAKSFEEADMIVNIHPYKVIVGSYTSGGFAYKTYTMVVTIDLKNGGERASHKIGEKDPPQTITVYNNIPASASGEFLKKKALRYVKKLL